MAKLNRRLLLAGAIVAVGAGCSDDANRKQNRSGQELQDLLDEARAGKRTVVLHPGEIVSVDKPLDLRGVALEGRGSTIRVLPTFSGPAVLRVEGAVTVSGVSIVGSAAMGTKVSGIVARAARIGLFLRLNSVRVSSLKGDAVRVLGNRRGGQPGSLVIRDMTIEGGDRGLVVLNAGSVRLKRVTVSECQRSGLHFSSCQDARVATVTSIGNGLDPVREGDGLVATYCKGLKITDSSFTENTRRGISLGGGDPRMQPNRDWLISGCTADDNGDHGITLDPTIRDQEGIPVASPGRLVGCSVRRNGHNGINITCAADVQIRDNNVKDNASHGISVASARVTVEGNTIGGNAGRAVAVHGTSSTRPRYTDVVVRGNRVG